MTTYNMTAMVSTIFAVTGLLCSMSNKLMELQACHGDMMGLVTNCMMYVQKVLPLPNMNASEACCNALNTADIPCLCHGISGQLEQTIIDTAKIVSVAESCGKPLAHRTQCGSKKTLLKPLHNIWYSLSFLSLQRLYINNLNFLLKYAIYRKQT